MYDVIIIGGGPAGLSAGLYCGRLNLKTLILTKTLGGQVSYTSEIENYLGVDRMSGVELVEKFYKQVQNVGVEIKFEPVTKIESGDVIKVYGNKIYEAKTLIIATGRKPRLLGVEGEGKFLGRGVSTCAVCDGPLYKDKVVAVVGGGNSALDAVYYLSKIAKKVYLIHRRNEFRAYEFMVKKALSKKNVVKKTPYVIKRILGDKKVEAIVIENRDTQKESKIKVDGVFVEIGYDVESSLYEGIVDTNEKGEILIDVDCRTSEKNIFAAGDVTSCTHKQAIIAAGDGAKAALSAADYLSRQK